MSVKLKRYTTKGVHPQYSPRPDPDGYWVEYDKVAPLEARVRELEAARAGASQDAETELAARNAAEQKLADANALLGDALGAINQEAWTVLAEAIRAHLSGQPAAPSRTEAEKAVLDAMAAADIEQVGGRNRLLRRFMFELQEDAACRAELARRGLK